MEKIFKTLWSYKPILSSSWLIQVGTCDSTWQPKIGWPRSSRWEEEENGTYWCISLTTCHDQLFIIQRLIYSWLRVSPLSNGCSIALISCVNLISIHQISSGSKTKTRHYREVKGKCWHILNKFMFISFTANF